MPLPFTTDDIVILPATTTEDPATGNDVLTYPEPADGTLVRGSFQPQSSVENVSGREQVITTHRVFLPGDMALKATDRLMCRGQLLEVDGEPQRWPDPFDGSIHHIEANVIIVTG